LGDTGTIMYGSHGAGGVRIIPESKMQAYQQPEKALPRGLQHYRDWLDAIRSGTKAGSDFTTYGGPLTELAMLGVITIKFPGTKLLEELDRILGQHEGKRLAESPNALGCVPIEATREGVLAVAESELVEAVLEDQPISALSWP